MEHAHSGILVLPIGTMLLVVAQHVVVDAAVFVKFIWCGACKLLYAVLSCWTVCLEKKMSRILFFCEKNIKPCV